MTTSRVWSFVGIKMGTAFFGVRQPFGPFFFFQGFDVHGADSAR